MHLTTHKVDGATVAEVLFEGGRLAYPGRKDIEYQLKMVEPYGLEQESRVIDGLPRNVCAAVKYLALVATEAHSDLDATLELLWRSHSAHAVAIREEGPALDRLVAALVTIQDFREHQLMDLAPAVERASELVIAHFHQIGFPMTAASLEEIFDGAEPACLGLSLVEL